jgi:carbon starvation protein
MPEPTTAMSLPLLATIVTAALVAGYVLYGRFLARQFSLRDDARTPAHELQDGEDFVPTPRFYLLGQHFSAIAAAGPIVGPILACRQFGWLPCILWIGFGVILVGAVHDFTALVASVRHKARSIAEIVREHVGSRAWAAMLAFIWVALLYVILAFTDVTAQTFLGQTEEFTGIEGAVSFNAGGAVAAAAVMYLVLASVMGLVTRLWNPKLWVLTAIFVPGTLGVIWLGTKVSTLLLFPHATWAVLILVYCVVASLIPVWSLLQPRGYLGGFILYGVLAIGVFGIFLGGYDIRMPATTGAPLLSLDGAPVFPFLFVTIACGACSGFHGLVCSGTTSKQIDKESHCTTVGYGAMLLEGLVALVALATVMILPLSQAKDAPPSVLYGNGIALFLTKIIGPEHLRFAQVFGTMAFSTFVFDTLDVATRLGRYILQELTGTKGRASAVVATLVTAGVPLAILLTAGKDGYRTFWTLFGTSNQLLAALTLLGISVWLRRTGRPCWFTVVPMLFVLAITVLALVLQVRGFLAQVRSPDGSLVAGMVANATVGVVLLGLAAWFGVEAGRSLLRK